MLAINTTIGPHPSPIYALFVDGKDLSASLRGRLSTLTLTDNRGFEADQLDIVLDDSDGQLKLPYRGALLSLSLGWKESGLIDKGSYTVDEVTHEGAPDTITVRARSANLAAGLTTQRERSFHNTTVGDIVRTIAAENDDSSCSYLVPMISPQLDTLVIEHLDQTNESSANLLTRMAGMFDAIATVKNGTLMFIHCGAGLSASGKKLPTVTITRAEGDKHHFSIADRGNYTHVKARWNDTGAGQMGEVLWSKEEDAAEQSNKAPPSTAAVSVGEYKTLRETYKTRTKAAREARKEWERIKTTSGLRKKYVGVKATYNDLNLKVTGTVLHGDANDQQERSNATKQSKRDAAALAATKPQVAIQVSADDIKTLRHLYASEETAKHAARANWRRLQRGMAEFSLTLALGRPELFPEMPAVVQGFKREIDSTDWTITRATHSLSDAGLTTKLEFEIKATEIPG